jgi:hypothetical protein
VSDEILHEPARQPLFPGNQCGMVISRRALGCLLALTALPLLFAFLTRGPDTADAQGTPVVASPNVTKLGPGVPGTVAISGVFSRSAPYFYVSGVDSVSVIDVSDPRNPKLAGKLVNAVFENEAMTLGERIGKDGKIQRFVLVGNDLGQATIDPKTGTKLGRIGGRQLTVVDVTDPANPHIAGQTPSTGKDAVTTSTHTVACMNPSCSIAYTAGDDAHKVSIIDLSDLSKPHEIKTFVSPATWENPVFSSPAGHHWNVDGAGIAWHAGAGGSAAFDISDPLNPKLLNGTDANGRKSPYNDFIEHNIQRPNALAFKPGKPLGVQNGNVALITEEDYANDGDEVECDKAGTFQTWEIPDLDGAAYRAKNPKSEPDKGDLHVLDTFSAPLEGGGGLTTPVGGFCSAHWFDFHPSGIVALGNYQQGLRLIDVRNPRDLKQFGFFTGGGTEVWDAYWAPQRDKSGTVVPGRKTNIVYTVDAVQGVGVYEVSDMPPDLPVTGDDGPRGTFPAAPSTVAADEARRGQPVVTSGQRAGSTRKTVICGSRRNITITVPGVGKSRLRSVKVTIDGKKVTGKRIGRKQVRVTLANKKKGSYTVRITGRTRSGKRVSTTRRYKTCTARGK